MKQLGQRSVAMHRIEDRHRKIPSNRQTRNSGGIFLSLQWIVYSLREAVAPQAQPRPPRPGAHELAENSAGPRAAAGSFSPLFGGKRGMRGACRESMRRGVLR